MVPTNRQLLETITDLESVFGHARIGKKRLLIAGHDTSIRRMECFAVKGTVCVKCKLIVGDVLRLERWGDKSLHLDLYGINSMGKEVLMTIDHITPASKGGPDHIDNFQPMCQPCNTKKGNKV